MLAGRLPDEPIGLAPIPTTFADVMDPSNPGMQSFAGTAEDPIANPDYDYGPGVVAHYRYTTVFDAPTPQGEVEVTVFSARELADIRKSVGEQVDSPVDGVECWSYSNPKVYDCNIDYGNGWLLTASAPPGLTETTRTNDLYALAAILQSVKANNAFDRAVQTHANM